jgi:hypothetical protein
MLSASKYNNTGLKKPKNPIFGVLSFLGVFAQNSILSIKH